MSRKFLLLNVSTLYLKTVILDDISKHYDLQFKDLTLTTKTDAYVYNITNHPVHIFDRVTEQLSPSSFIPLCDFGGDSHIMGVRIKQFNDPVCDSFRTKILNDQRCYEVDLNKFHESFSSTLLMNGFTFFVDLNRDRQYPNTKYSGKRDAIKNNLQNCCSFFRLLPSNSEKSTLIS